MTTPGFAVGRVGLLTAPQVAGRIRALLERDAFAVVVIAVATAKLAMSTQMLVVQDTFLALVDGRLIARHGLPHVDTLTYWTLGRPWTDQQWGGHLLLYELAQRGGLRAVVLAGLGCVAAALAVGAVATRKLGASPRSVMIGLLMPVAGAPWLAQVRTQSLALVPFVLVYGLLALDARRPGRRVLLVLPLLVIWANLHGSVSLAAGLTALYGLTLLRRPGARVRASLLVVGAPLCVLASPYGLDLVGYYRMMLLSPPLAHVVEEWKAPSVGIATVGFFLSAFAATGLWSRHQRVLTSFERWALVILLLGAMTAVRNAVWFELALVVSLPRLVDAAWRPSAGSPAAGARRINALLGSVAVIAATALIAVQFASPGYLETGRSPAAAAAVAAAAGAHGLVLADDEHADWLLWQQPSLEGRIAYDVRFELFNGRELAKIMSLWHGSRPTWRGCGQTASVVTFWHPSDERFIRREGVLNRSTRSIVRSPEFSAVAQPPAAKPCRL